MSETTIQQRMAVERERSRIRQQVAVLLHALHDYIPPRLMPEAEDRLAEVIEKSDVVMVTRAELAELKSIREHLALQLTPVKLI